MESPRRTCRCASEPGRSHPTTPCPQLYTLIVPVPQGNESAPRALTCVERGDPLSGDTDFSLNKHCCSVTRTLNRPSSLLHLIRIGLPRISPALIQLAGPSGRPAGPDLSRSRTPAEGKAMRRLSGKIPRFGRLAGLGECCLAKSRLAG